MLASLPSFAFLASGHMDEQVVDQKFVDGIRGISLHAFFLLPLVGDKLRDVMLELRLRHILELLNRHGSQSRNSMSQPDQLHMLSWPLWALGHACLPN